jgi:hypothetical protein
MKYTTIQYNTDTIPIHYTTIKYNTDTIPYKRIQYKTIPIQYRYNTDTREYNTK